MPRYRGTVEVRLADGTSPPFRTVHGTVNNINIAFARLLQAHPEYSTAKSITVSFQEDTSEDLSS